MTWGHRPPDAVDRTRHGEAEYAVERGGPPGDPHEPPVPRWPGGLLNPHDPRSGPPAPASPAAPPAASRAGLWAGLRAGSTAVPREGRPRNSTGRWIGVVVAGAALAAIVAPLVASVADDRLQSVPTIVALPDETAATSAPGSELRLGASASIGGWSLTPESADLDADDEVAAANQFNVPPPPGSRYALVHLRALNRTDRAASIVTELNIEVRDGTGEVHGRFECGVVPDPLSSDEFETGTGPAGNVCFVVPVAALDGATLEVRAFVTFTDPPVRWRLTG